MTARPDDALDQLIHEVNSKCSGLRGAAALLRASTPADKEELLALMARQAAKLAKSLSDFRGRRRPKGPPPTRTHS